MAGSQFAYVRNFELPDPVLPNTFMVVRIDGRGFHKFSEAHSFSKPNDATALELMNEAARSVMLDIRPDVILAFGESDEFSFLLKRSCSLYERRESKILTHIVSRFTSSYVFSWPRFFPNLPLQYPPAFDGRLVVYPGEKEVRDYFAWRQADTHINNLYNTTFWALIQHGGQTEREAHEALKGTVSADKNEILFKQFEINYNRLEPLFRKGTTIVWDSRPDPENCSGSNPGKGNQKKAKGATELRTLHVDIIGTEFWKEIDGEAEVRRKLGAKEDGSESLESVPWHDTRRTTDYHGLGQVALSQ